MASAALVATACAQHRPCHVLAGNAGLGVSAPGLGLMRRHPDVGPGAASPLPGRVHPNPSAGLFERHRVPTPPESPSAQPALSAATPSWSSPSLPASAPAPWRAPTTGETGYRLPGARTSATGHPGGLSGARAGWWPRPRSQKLPPGFPAPPALPAAPSQLLKRVHPQRTRAQDTLTASEPRTDYSSTARENVVCVME